MKLGKKGTKIEVNDPPFLYYLSLYLLQIVEIDLVINLEDMHLEMECLFPK